MQIVSVVGARPQFVKLAPITHAVARAGVKHKIVHTGQHYDPMLSDVFFENLGIPIPDRHLGVGSGSHGVQTGAMLAELDEVFTDLQPDWVLVYGDTNSTIAAALSAVKLRFPVAHLEAGLRSFNRTMPEEINRILTDHASDLLLAPTKTAADHLANEGLADKTIIVGDVMTDVLLSEVEKLGDAPSPVAQELGFGDGEYSLATVHRAENTDDPNRLARIVQSLQNLDHPVILLAHPRTVAKAKEQGLDLSGGSLHLHEPLSYPNLLASARRARGIITDSGGLQKEAFLLGVLTTTVRPQTEWVETVKLGWNQLVEPDGIIHAATREKPEVTNDTPYGDGHAADRVISVLRDSGR